MPSSVRTIAGLSGACLVWGTDQAVKFFLRDAHDGIVWQNGPLKIWHSFNPSIAFSLPLPTLLIVLAIVAALIFVTWMYLRLLPHRVATAIALGLVWGGSLSNVYDRVRYGSVIDYFQVSISPIINIADLGIALGLAYFFIVFLKKEKQKNVIQHTRTSQPS